jgi:LEA14-like dessication related protein
MIFYPLFGFFHLPHRSRSGAANAYGFYIIKPFFLNFVYGTNKIRMGISISRSIKVINVLIAISVIVFVASMTAVAYTLLHSIPTLSIGAPSQNISDGVLEIIIPANVTNRGFLAISISDLSVIVAVKGVDGEVAPLIEARGNRLTLPPGESGTLWVRTTMDTSKISPEIMRAIMVDDQEFKITTLFRGSVQPFFNILVSANDTLRWGAPFKDLQMHDPSFGVYNATHLLIEVPISFKNNSTMFSVSGTGKIIVVDEEYKVVGYGQAYMNVRPGSEYSGTIDVYLETPWVGHPELLTQSLLKNYTIKTELQAPLFGEFKQTQTVSIKWGAPISDPELGGFSVSAHNSTHSKIFIPLTFKDASMLPLTGTLRGSIYDLSGNKVGELEDLWLEVQPGQTYLGTITGYISNAAAPQQGLTLVIKLDVPYGTLEKELTINAQTP